MGVTQESFPSSFLEPIPEVLLERRETRRLSRSGGGFGRSDRDWSFGRDRDRRKTGWDEPDEGSGLVVDYSDSQDMPRFIKGEVVIHPQFGRGIVRELSGFGLDLKATIEFEGVGRKRVVVRYANLQKEL